jgi:hypothetical protein
MGRARANDDDTWAAIRDAAFQVILLTRHEEGLWSLPTHARDIDRYAPEYTREDENRKGQLFGHPSITVSFNALVALGTTIGEWPPPLSGETLEKLEECRSTEGGFGSPGSRKDGEEPNAVPRHTAMALVMQLLFDPRAPQDVASGTERAVRWLLSKRNPNSGWSYSWEKWPALGYQSTAASICALCLFLDLRGRSPGMVAELEVAIQDAYRALVDLRDSSLWDGDGVPPHNQARDAAFALRMLMLANRSGTLDRLKPSGAPSVRELIQDYSAWVVQHGWAAQIGGTGFSVPTAISALHMILEAGNPAKIPSRELALARKAILADWRGGHFGYRMTSWDWQCAALLATELAGPLPLLEARRQIEKCRGLRSRRLEGPLRIEDLEEVVPEARPAVAFALTSGRGFSTPLDPPERETQRPQDLFDWLRDITNRYIDPVSIWGGAVGLLVLVGSALVYLHHDFLRASGNSSPPTNEQRASAPRSPPSRAPASPATPGTECAPLLKEAPAIHGRAANPACRRAAGPRTDGGQQVRP